MEKCCNFMRGKYDIFQWGKIGYFLLAVLYWTADSGQWTGQRDSSGRWTVDSGQWTVDSGQWTVDSGQWTDGLSSTGQGTLDGPSCTGQNRLGTAGQWTLDKWTVDGTEWTELLSLL